MTLMEILTINRVITVIHSSTEKLDCVEGIVSDQCGNEIARHLRLLVTKAMEQLGCQTQRQRL